MTIITGLHYQLYYTVLLGMDARPYVPMGPGFFLFSSLSTRSLSVHYNLVLFFPFILE
jgi:hypothetical protein